MAFLHPVELLKRQYLQMLHPEQLRMPPAELLRLAETQAQIYNAMFAEEEIAYPPPDRYRYRVLKLLMNALEGAIDDPEEDVRLPL